MDVSHGVFLNSDSMNIVPVPVRIKLCSCPNVDYYAVFVFVFSLALYIAFMVPAIIFLSFFVTSVFIVKDVVLEKERKLKVFILKGDCKVVLVIFCETIFYKQHDMTI